MKAYIAIALTCLLAASGIGAEDRWPDAGGFGQGVTLANLGGAAPTNCAVQGDIHQDLDTGQLWICTIAATNTFVASARNFSLIWGASPGATNGQCLTALTWASSGATSCGTNASVTANIAARAGATVVLLRSSCWVGAGHVGLDAAPDEVRVRLVWGQGSQAGAHNTTDATTSMVFLDADDQLMDFVTDNTIDISPYTGSQQPQVRVNTVGTITTVGSLNCRFEFAEL